MVAGLSRGRVAAPPRGRRREESVGRPNATDRARQVTAKHVAKLHKVLDDLGPGTTTNLWGGLKTALDALNETAAERPRTVVVLTDGCPNESPPGGEARALQDQRTKNNADELVSVHTFGFGRSRRADLAPTHRGDAPAADRP